MPIPKTIALVPVVASALGTGGQRYLADGTLRAEALAKRARCRWRKISQRKFSGKPRDAKRNFGIWVDFVEFFGRKLRRNAGKTVSKFEF